VNIAIIIGLVLMLLGACGAAIPKTSIDLWKLGLTIVIGALVLGQGIK
jgi:hypothetical protein